MGYFTSPYFTSPYFDTGTPAVSPGHPHAFPSGHRAWDTRNVTTPPVPAWLAIAARKRKRKEDELLRRLLAAKRAWLRLTDDEYLLDLAPYPRMS
jgi:hypothetical protein